MSQEAIKQIVSKMFTDEEFRGSIIADPEAVIQAEGYEVTEKELAALKALEAEDLADMSLEELEERLSKKNCEVAKITTDAAKR